MKNTRLLNTVVRRSTSTLCETIRIEQTTYSTPPNSSFLNLNADT